MHIVYIYEVFASTERYTLAHTHNYDAQKARLLHGKINQTLT